MLDVNSMSVNEVPVSYQVGHLYDETSTLPIPAVAERLERDILDLRGDGLIVDHAAFTVTAEESESHGIVRVVVSELAERPVPTGFENDIIRDTIKTVFELASHYNRVECARPDRCRFIVAIDIESACGKIISGLIGSMSFRNW